MKRSTDQIIDQVHEAAQIYALAVTNSKVQRKSIEIAYLEGARAMAIGVGRPVDGPLAARLRALILRLERLP